ncbi:MAG: efflux RND transporter permease subunit, partial [Candidatus Zipacnadales bacterium]
MWITRVAVRRRITMLMIIGAMMILGLTRMRRMPLEYFPAIDIPVVTVATVYPGAGPDEIEQRVTKPLEDAIAIVSGVDELSSTSQENMSVVVARFEMEVDVDVAAADVRDAVNQARAQFPHGVEAPIVRKLDINALPIVRLGVSGNRSPKDLLNFVEEEIKPRFGQVNGVSSVNVTGGEEREIRIEAHKEQLEAVGLSISQLAQLVAAENLDVPGGELDEGGQSFTVRAAGQFKNLDEIRRLRLVTPLGGTVYLSEIADVSDSVAKATTITRLNGKPTVGINILRQTNANTVQVSDGVHKAIEEMENELPEDIDFTVYYDSAEDTREAVRDVLESLILGALLASVVTYLFLHNVRAMIIV